MSLEGCPAPKDDDRPVTATARTRGEIAHSPDGWLIFKLPPAELGVHPGETPQHEFTLMCDDLNSTMAELGEKGIEFRGEPRDQGFGIVTTMLLPGGIQILLYEPKHNSPLDL